MNNKLIYSELINDKPEWKKVSVYHFTTSGNE